MQQIIPVTKEYILEILAKGKRDDGRNLLDYRAMKITKGTMPNAEGSAEVTIGNTRVLSGVKLGVGTPMPDKPGEGNLMTSAELLPLASPDYETGPPSPEAIELARVVDRGIRAAGMIDTKVLAINEEKVWDVFVDLYVLNYDGNLFDACTTAATTALVTARMPKYEDEKVIREGNLGKLKTNNLVTSSTFAKIGNKIMIDPDGKEEVFMDSRVTIATDESVIRAMQKGLSGSFSFKELEDAIATSFAKGKDIRSMINKVAGE